MYSQIDAKHKKDLNNSSDEDVPLKVTLNKTE